MTRRTRPVITEIGDLWQVNLIDANILLYAYDESSDQHQAAAEFLKARLSGTEPAGLSWSAILGFLRIGTNSRAFTNPLTIKEAREPAAKEFSSRIRVRRVCDVFTSVCEGARSLCGEV